LIGHEGHDEVIGTMGEAPEAIVLVETPEDVDRLEIADENRVAYLTQTTLSLDDATRIIARLRERFPNIVSPPTEDICYATQNRQEAVKILAHEADLCLVLGSQNSSNSQRLAEIARESGIPAYLIDDAAEIDLAWFAGVETVLITAGASDRRRAPGPARKRPLPTPPRAAQSRARRDSLTRVGGILGRVQLGVR
jgi:4-hydroxy-3-methylbut-2-enyl diphosphate reductase